VGRKADSDFYKTGEREEREMLRRTEQVNIRLYKDEKRILTEAAIKRGHNSLSEFLRCAAIAELKKINRGKP